MFPADTADFYEIFLCISALPNCNLPRKKYWYFAANVSKVSIQNFVDPCHHSTQHSTSNVKASWLSPYKLQIVQLLKETDFARWKDFCEQFLCLQLLEDLDFFFLVKRHTLKFLKLLKLLKLFGWSYEINFETRSKNLQFSPKLKCVLNVFMVSFYWEKWCVNFLYYM